MSKHVEVKGLGVVAFPENMPDHEINWAIEEHTGKPRVDRIRGMADLPLTKAGRRQIAEKSEKLGPFDTIFTNDLKRAQETAKLLRPNRIVTDTHLRPMNYGDYTGRPSKEVAEKMHSEIKANPKKALPGSGDSFHSWSRRLAEGIAHVQDYVKAHPKEKVGVVLNRSSMQLYKTLLKGGTIDDALAYSPDEKTGSAFMREGDELKPVDKADGPGEYIVRHGATPFNGTDESESAAS
jgi:probable phosphoglycerate mutase